jgi:hypothetical protein
MVRYDFVEGHGFGEVWRQPVAELNDPDLVLRTAGIVNAPLWFVLIRTTCRKDPPPPPVQDWLPIPPQGPQVICMSVYNLATGEHVRSAVTPHPDAPIDTAVIHDGALYAAHGRHNRILITRWKMEFTDLPPLQ